MLMILTFCELQNELTAVMQWASGVMNRPIVCKLYVRKLCVCVCVGGGGGGGGGGE